MASFYSLPFYETSERLAAPLPTLEETTGRRIVRVGHHFLVKYSLNVNLIEGENMLFVGHSSNVPLPQVYAVYTDKATGFNYIKAAVSDKLRDIIGQLRTLPCPGDFGSFGNRALQDSMFWTADDAATAVINDPFETEAQLNEAMVRKYLYNNITPQKAEFCQRILPRVLQNRDLIFSDASYWEYTLAIFTCGRWDNDWHVWVAKILDEYPNEYVWMDMLRRELWS
ncbi:phosphotransferase enzyme family protein [Rhexocercosporidium sp. MPI-PUGE-AT-0058]|nr:phosphotransferase enzyme family protein [Rhexocercosporidium sp. MPI-PUGE-AT-0058]